MSLRDVAHGAERAIEVPKKPGAGLVVRAVRAGVAEADERRRRTIDGALHLGDGRAELRPAAIGDRGLARMMAVEHLLGVVIGLIADE